MSVAISWANKMQLAKCDIMVGFPISSHICTLLLLLILAFSNQNFERILNVLSAEQLMLSLNMFN